MGTDTDVKELRANDTAHVERIAKIEVTTSAIMSHVQEIPEIRRSLDAVRIELAQHRTKWTMLTWFAGSTGAGLIGVVVKMLMQ